MNNQNFNNGNQGFQQQPNFQQPNYNQMQQQQQGFQQQAPQQQMQQQAPQQVYSNNIIEGSFTIETAGVDFSGGPYGNPNRNPNLIDIPEGLQFARLYKLVDIGTHAGYKGESNRILKFFFEFPSYQQQFNLDDPQMKPSVLSTEINFFTGEKSKLRKLCNACLGRTLSDEEIKHFDFINLLDSVVCVTVVRKQSKTNGKFYTNLGEFSAIGAMPVPPEFNNPQLYRNPLTAFYLGPNSINLSKENFANLPLGDRRKIMQSTEAQAYVMAGNRVYRNQNNQRDNFYNDGTDVHDNQAPNNNSGFNQFNGQPQQAQQYPQQAVHQQPQGNAQFAPQGGFNQQAPAQGNGQFGAQSYNDPNAQAFNQGGNGMQGANQQAGFNAPVQNQAQFPQGQAPTHPFQNGNQNGFAQPQGQQFQPQAQQYDPNQVSPQMNQAVQQVQQQFGGQPQQVQQMDQQPQQDGGFGAFLNQQTGGQDDLPF